MIVRGVAVAAAVTLLAATAAGCGGSKKDSGSDSAGNAPASSTPAVGGGAVGGGKDYKPLNAKEKAEFLKGWRAMVGHPIPPAEQDAYVAEAGKACSGAYGYNEKPVEAGVAKSLKLNSSDASSFVMALSQACSDRGHH